MLECILTAFQYTNMMMMMCSIPTTACQTAHCTWCSSESCRLHST